MIIKRYEEFINESKIEEFTFKINEICGECNGEGYKTREETCETCEGDNTFEYNFKYIQYKGVDKLYIKNGIIDNPIQYDDGIIIYDYPNMHKNYIKNICEVIFNNKDSNIQEVSKAIIYHMSENSISMKLLDDSFIDILDADCVKIINGTKNISKFKL